MSKVHVFSDSETLAHDAAQQIIEMAARSIASHNYFSIALAGGRTPRILYRLLTKDPYSSQIDWENVHIFWGDERYVLPESIDSNYRMVKESLLSLISIPSKNVHPYNTRLSPHSCAVDYEKKIQHHFKLDDQRLPCFDCILLGLGADGHTASLFPDSNSLDEQKRLVIADYVEKLRNYRLTLSLPVINNANVILFLVSGEEKSNILVQVLSGKQKDKSIPATLVVPKDGTLIWLIDEVAYSSREQ